MLSCLAGDAHKSIWGLQSQSVVGVVSFSQFVVLDGIIAANHAIWTFCIRPVMKSLPSMSLFVSSSIGNLPYTQERLPCGGSLTPQNTNCLDSYLHAFQIPLAFWFWSVDIWIWCLVYPGESRTTFGKSFQWYEKTQSWSRILNNLFK